jgi:hypothetical protein
MGIITNDPEGIEEQRSVVAATLRDTLNAGRRTALILVDMAGHSID